MALSKKTKSDWERFSDPNPLIKSKNGNGNGNGDVDMGKWEISSIEKGEGPRSMTITEDRKGKAKEVTPPSKEAKERFRNLSPAEQAKVTKKWKESQQEVTEERSISQIPIREAKLTTTSEPRLRPAEVELLKPPGENGKSNGVVKKKKKKKSHQYSQKQTKRKRKPRCKKDSYKCPGW